jgi:ferredoxin-type protein NapH
MQLLSTIFVFTVAVGGIFVPELGLALAALMAAAIVMTLIKPRSFCSGVCPRGKTLGFVMNKSSRRKALPRFMLSAKFSRLLCGSTMFCVVGSLVRTGGAVHLAGTVFWVLCIVSLSAGVIMGYFFKPRSWCAICPMGTLQDTISGR